MVTKVYYTDKDVKAWIHHIIRGMQFENWKPDYIVGVTRGGLVPANMISQYSGIPMHTLNVSLRDSDFGPESNLWMAEDAFGHDASPDATAKSNPTLRKNILIVDDINDSGATINWIKDDWKSGCFPNDPGWEDVWSNNVRFAVLVHNDASDFKNPDYVGKIINKAEKDEWCVFPWENWWE
jgi:xanthine phosphoribosyltransferase